MKILIVLFAVFCAYQVSAGSLAKPDTRASFSAQLSLSSVISNVCVTAAVGNQTLLAAGSLSMFQGTGWAAVTLAQQKTNMVKLSLSVLLLQGNLNTMVVTPLNAAIIDVTVQGIVSVVKAATQVVIACNSVQSQQIIIMEQSIVQNLTQFVVTVSNLPMNIFATYSSQLTDATYQMLSATIAYESMCSYFRPIYPTKYIY